MPTQTTNADRFLQANKRVINKVSEQCRGGRVLVKSGYARYSFLRYNLLQVKFYATSKNVELSIAWGCLPYGGLGETIVQEEFITADDTKDWNDKDWNKYVRDVVKYITKLIEFSENLEFAFEDYASVCLDYKPFVKELMKDIPDSGVTGNDASWWISEDLPPCEYCINAFAGFPVAYYQIENYLKAMKLLQSVMKKEWKATSMLYEKEQRTGVKYKSEDYGKALLKLLTDTEKEKVAPFIYTGEHGDTT